MKSKIKSKYTYSNDKRFCQGDIIRDISYVQWAENKKIIILEIPYSIILTQDCDLESDFRDFSQKKEEKNSTLPSILLIPAYRFYDFQEGIHLLDYLSIKTSKKFQPDMEKIKDEKEKRYHYLQQNLDLQIPELIIDFKHYYTIPRDILYKRYKKNYIGSLNELFREALSQRFTNYLCRIGLPDLCAKKSNKLDNST